jgi:MFS family permease
MADVVDHTAEREEPGRLGRSFWQVWSASSLSNLADGLVKVALPLVAVTLTDSPGLVAGVTLAVTLPWLLFALPVGALADRVDRRLAMVTADVVRAAAVAVLAVALVLGLESSAAAIWALYAVALLLGTAETVYDTCAQSILPQVVPRDRLPRANGRLIAAELTANEFVGPPLGGLLVAAGVAAAFATPAVLWAAAVGALLLLHGSFAVPRQETPALLLGRRRPCMHRRGRVVTLRGLPSDSSSWTVTLALPTAGIVWSHHNPLGAPPGYGVGVVAAAPDWVQGSLLPGGGRRDGRSLRVR